MVIHESAEDYLESILVLQQRRGQVRSIDIVNELGYSKPSVSIAMTVSYTHLDVYKRQSSRCGTTMCW